MTLRELVDLAISNYEGLPQAPLSEDLPEEDQYLATPHRLSYALGWIVASEIVAARFADSGIDALPVFHPEHGWDRFLLTRRTTSRRFQNEPADSFGMIMLSDENAPRVTRPDGTTRIAVGDALRKDPQRAAADVRDLFPPYGLPASDLGGRWDRRKKVYPMLYRAVAELIVENPGLVAAREVFIDTQPIDGQYHPLYLHGIAQHPTMVYDWFLLQLDDRAVFVRTHGGQTIYETDRGGWSTVKKQIADEPTMEDMKRRMTAWLRISGQPDPKTRD